MVGRTSGEMDCRTDIPKDQRTDKRTKQDIDFYYIVYVLLIRHQLRDRVIQINHQLQTKPKQNQKRRVNRTQLQYGEQDEKL